MSRDFEIVFFCLCMLVFQATFSCFMSHCVCIFLYIHPCSVISSIVPGADLSFVLWYDV